MRVVVVIGAIAWLTATVLAVAHARPTNGTDSQDVDYVCCDADDHYDDRDEADRDDDEDGCLECRRYCSGFAAAEQPFFRHCVCNLSAPCRDRVGYVIELPPDNYTAGDVLNTSTALPPPPTTWTEESTWYANARMWVSGCSVTAIVLTVVVYGAVLEPRGNTNFVKHYAFWLLITTVMTLIDDQRKKTVLKGFETKIGTVLPVQFVLDGYLMLFTISVTNNLQIVMNYEVYFFLKSIQEVNSYYTRMFKNNLYFHGMCCGYSVSVTGLCFCIEAIYQYFSNAHFDFNNVKNFNFFYLLPGLISICINSVVFYCISKLETRFVSNRHPDVSRIYREKLLIRKQLFGLVGMLWLIDVVCAAVQLFGINCSVLQDLKMLQGVGTFIILVFKRSIIDQIKKWILTHNCIGVRPNEL